MRPGGYVMVKINVPIGFVKPPPGKKPKYFGKFKPAAAPQVTEDTELQTLVANADALLGKPKAELPRKEPRPAKVQKPLGKINV